MPTVLPLRPGDPRRAGRYRLLGRIDGFTDAEGNPDAFLGRAPSGDQVTVTLLTRQPPVGKAARDRLAAEARAARRVDPFCVARIVDAGLSDGHPYLVSEHVPGVSLREAAAADGALSGPALTALAAGTATGLAAIHQAGLVHGAFGPDHVILGPDGVRVVHFSITPPYGAATPAADVLAWALTMTFAALGRPAVSRRDLAALPDPLRAVVARCLAPDPATRPAIQAVLARLLNRDGQGAVLLAEGAQRARATAQRPPPARQRRMGRARRRRRSRAAGLALACTGCLLAVGAAAWVISGRPGDLLASLDNGASHPAATPSAGRPRVVPASLAGTWTGQVRQVSPVLAVIVRVTLTAGRAAGTVGYPALGCSGTLQLVATAPGSVTVTQHITAGRRSCEDGVITLALQRGGQLRFAFHRASGHDPAGLLARARPAPSPSPS